MPTYEYECKSCGHSFEAFQSMADDPLKTCPECGKEIRRVINGGSGVIFTGSGFYATDKTASKAPAKAEGQTPCAGCAAAQSGACAQAAGS